MDTRHKQLHDRANDLFSRQQYQQAAELFTQALQQLATTTTSSLGGSSSSSSKHQTPQQQQPPTSSSPRHSNNSHAHQNNHTSTNPNHHHRDLHLSCLSKRATCFLKLDQNEKALDDINKLLSLSPTRSSLGKLLMRKTQALSKLRKTQEAYETAKQWTSAEPKNGQASKEVNRLKKLLDEKTENQSTSRNTSARDKNGTEASSHSSQSSGKGQGASGGSTSSTSTHHQRGKRKAASEGKHKKDASKQENSENFCSFCQVQCSTQVDFHLHSMSESHRAIISSDEGRDWKHRPPPRGAVGEEYLLCADRLKCRFGQQCTYAHSEDELAEWKERYRYRQMKYQRARDKQIHGMSFAEQLFEKWMNSPTPLNVLSESIEEVKVSINSDSNVTVSSKNSAHSWIFTLHCKPSKQLQRVALFFDVHRPHFSIASILLGDSKRQSSQDIPENCQEWSSKMSSQINNNNINPYNSAKSKERIYRIKIQFTSQIFGTFRQSVVFDFGTEPVLMKRISVDSVSAMDQKELDEVRESMVCVTERWDGTNKTVVNFSPPIQMGTEQDKGLLSFYVPPHSTEELFKRSVLEKTITKNNYKNRMHDLLYIEETARFRDISKFNIRTTLQMATTFMLVPSRNSGARYAQNGQLFALMHLNDDLSDDTPGGRLILNSCTSVLLAPVQDGKTTEKVYEAPITEKSKDSIYLTLSKQCVDDLNLKSNSQIKVELQFQLSRLHLCEMHYAVDKVPDMSLLFPDVRTNAKVPWTPNKQWSDKMDMQMNSKQREAIVAMTTPLVHQLPPIFLVGPYGTGKTYTLAHATRLILQQPKTRILICTHSNSAADLYIRDYFHSFVESGNTAAKPLRIYFKDRWVPTVHPVVRLYCCMSDGEDRFVMPTKEQVEKHRVVVATLSTSRFLTHLELDQGYFTHILLDEAAQAMECETVMPLALATKDTRIVLAGDYMQISPQVHSEFVYDRHLHISLLERLYDHYPDTHPCKILLCANYRSHEAIVDYTSDLFYDGKLLASGKQPPHPKWYPLTFFTARGEDVQEKNSISFYNNAEVFELCDRVQELQKTWPEEWGTCDENSIGVVTHYSDQVFRIRHELRKRKLFNVSVERVMNVQGKQFRALFISTVRTHHTCKHMVKAQPSKKSTTGSKSKDPPQSSSEDEPDYGFLSNDKLLNTAITRAQSLVAVVGDPISACSIGKCRKLWEKFISMCNDNNSLHGCTFSSIQNQLSNVEMKKTYVLNPLAKEFIPRALRNQMMGVPFIQGSPPHGIATINHNLHRSVLSPSHTPTPPVPGNQPLPFFGGAGGVPSGSMVRPASPVPLIDPYSGRRVVYMPMMHMPVPVRMVHNPYYPFPHFPYMEPAVPYHPQFMHQGGFMIPQGMKQPHGQPGSPAHQPAQDKSQGIATKEATTSSASVQPGGSANRIPSGSPARDPRPMSQPVGQFDSGRSQHERQEVVAKIEEMQINEEYQYLLRTRGQTYADNFLANVKRSQSPKVGPTRQTSDTAPQTKSSQQQHQGQRSQSLYTEKNNARGASGQQLPFSNSVDQWNTSSESNQPNRDPWPIRTKSQNPRDTLDSTGNQPRIRDPAIIDQGPAFRDNNRPGHRLPYSPLESTPPNVFVDSHMPPYRDHEAKHQRDFSVQPSDLSPRTPANFMDASPGLSPLELAIQLGDAKGSFLGKSQSKSFTFNGTSPLTSPRDDPNHLAPPNSQTGFGHQAMHGKEHTFRPVSKDDRSSSPHGVISSSVGHQRWPQSSVSNNFSSTRSPQHQQDYNSYPQVQSLQNFSPTTPSLSSQESLPSPSSPYGQGSTGNLLGLSASPTNFKDDSKPSMSYASALRAPPKPKVRAKDERTKTASPDPLSLIKDLGNRQTKDGFYSIF